MHIGFIEDTHLHGGTQIWVVEAIKTFLRNNHKVSLLGPEGSWVIDQCSKIGAAKWTYDWDSVVNEDSRSQDIWSKALSECDVAVCTVHPPRDGFHCSVFAAKCIKKGGLATHLIPKTGTIVPEYLREFYLPDETIPSSVIAITDFTRRYLIESYNIPGEKVALIYQGTDSERFQHSVTNLAKAQSKYPLPNNASPILGSIGSFEHRKGHPVLFDALAVLVQGPLPNAHLMMVGDGPDELLLKERAITLGLENNITFFPFTDEPNFIFEILDITVLPSLYKEGLPNVLLESMSMGVPVVSSNIGGVSEIVIEGETGLMVEPGDKLAIANAIIKVWEDKQNYQRMKKYARKLITDKFDKATQFDNFATYFRSIKSKN